MKADPVQDQRTESPARMVSETGSQAYPRPYSALTLEENNEMKEMDEEEKGEEEEEGEEEEVDVDDDEEEEEGEIKGE